MSPETRLRDSGIRKIDARSLAKRLPTQLAFQMTTKTASRATPTMSAAGPTLA